MTIVRVLISLCFYKLCKMKIPFQYYQIAIKRNIFPKETVFTLVVFFQIPLILNNHF